MLYRKNIYAREQLLRILAGVGVAIYAWLGMTHGMLAIATGLGGLIFAVTGVFGWCPMCAAVGRKIKTG